MSNFAEINSSGIVLRICVVPDDQTHRGNNFLSVDLDLGGRWIESGDAQIGWAYLDGQFVPPQDPERGPQYKTRFSPRDYRKRFTADEQIAIRQAQLTDMEVGIVYDEFLSADYIDVDDPETERGIDLYISKGLVDPDRKSPLLEPELIPPAAD